MLAVGLMTTAIGNLLLWALARSSSSYPAFLLGMLIAGAGAGLLNSETTKVMLSAVPAQRAGMASGLTATTRYIGVLVGVAALGAVLARIASHSFIAGSVAAAATSLFAVLFLARYFRTRTLVPFAIYCLVAGLISVIRFGLF